MYYIYIYTYTDPLNSITYNYRQGASVRVARQLMLEATASMHKIQMHDLKAIDLELRSGCNPVRAG
jgi:hypothetical protein